MLADAQRQYSFGDPPLPVGEFTPGLDHRLSLLKQPFDKINDRPLSQDELTETPGAWFLAFELTALHSYDHLCTCSTALLQGATAKACPK